MSRVIFIILFGLNFVTSPCQGKITLPPGRDAIVVAPGTARVEIAWDFDDTITAGTVRRWNFVTKTESLAVVLGTASSVTKLSSLLEFEIEGKATLVLKNVNDSYNGTYEFSIQHAVTPERSRVSVFIAVRPNVTINCSSPIIVNEGKDARCLCKGEGGNPPASVTWYKDGKQIGVAGHEEKWLTLNNVNETNNGTYKCVAQSYNLKANTSIDIIVHFKPKVTSLTFSPEVVYIGENVTIECKASGYPAPRYTITLNDKLVLSNETMYELTNLNTSHAGSIITCTATNNVGNDSQSKGLPLKVRPSVTINCSSIITVNESDSVRCLCEGKGGYPPANVTWYDKDNKMIGDVGNEEKMLTLNNVKETNNGTYKCVAQSYNLPADKSIKVIVHFKPKVTSLTFSPKVVYIGENVTIECKASGYPAPSYTITLNDKLVLSNQMMYELTNLDSSHRRSIITCTATNILGSDSQSKDLPLIVRPSVRISCSSTITVNESDSVRCLCAGKGGYPPANVTWYDKDGEMIGDVGNEEQMLTLNNVNETNNGTYKCLAQSYNLPAEESIKIIVLFKPKVTSLTFSPKVVDIGENVTIECKASGYPAPSYTITLNDKLVLSNEMMYELTNLNTGHIGSIITCTATNILGSDSRSQRLPLKEKAACNKSNDGTKWYIIVIILVSGFIIGIIFSYIFVCLRRRFRNRKPQSSSEPKTIQKVNSIYQDLDLSKMNSEDNYQSLRVNSGRNDADYENQNDSAYAELNDVKDVENNYQSLT